MTPGVLGHSKPGTTGGVGVEHSEERPSETRSVSSEKSKRVERCVVGAVSDKDDGRYEKKGCNPSTITEYQIQNRIYRGGTSRERQWSQMNCTPKDT